MADYTELPGNRVYNQIDWGKQPMPPCQAALVNRFVHSCSEPGEFDSPTVAGPWADLCKAHAEQLSRPNSKLGYHRISKTEG